MIYIFETVSRHNEKKNKEREMEEAKEEWKMKWLENAEEKK